MHSQKQGSTKKPPLLEVHHNSITHKLIGTKREHTTYESKLSCENLWCAKAHDPVKVVYR
jgi:hypothetical protein